MDLNGELMSIKINKNEVDGQPDVEYFRQLAEKILTPLDVAMNEIHAHEVIRKIYFSLADSRERLIQFMGKKPEIAILRQVLLQMNYLLNKLFNMQNTPCSADLEYEIITSVVQWRSIVHEVIRNLSKTPEPVEPGPPPIP